MLEAANSIELLNILKFTDFKSWTAIAGCTQVLGDFGGMLIEFLLVGGYQGNYRIRIGVHIVPITSGGIVCVKVYEVNHSYGTFKLLEVIDPVAFGLLGICEEVLAAWLQ